MILLCVLQSLSIIVFLLLILLKKNIYFFGNAILFFQILILFGVIIIRILGQGVNFFVFCYIILLQLIIIEWSIFSSKRKPSRIKLLTLEMTKKLENNFFNLLFWNSGSFYLSRYFFKSLWLSTENLLKQPFKIIFFVCFFWTFFWLTLTYELYFENKLYFSGIFLSIIFLFNRFFFLILKILDYFSKESLNYLNNKYYFEINPNKKSRLPYFSNDLYQYFKKKKIYQKFKKKN